MIKKIMLLYIIIFTFALFLSLYADITSTVGSFNVDALSWFMWGFVGIGFLIAHYKKKINFPAWVGIIYSIFYIYLLKNGVVLTYYTFGFNVALFGAIFFGLMPAMILLYEIKRIKKSKES